MELQHKVYTEKRDTSILLSTTQLRGQVSNAIPELGTVSPLAVPNWLQSPLKPRAWLCMKVVTDRGDQRPRVDYDESKIEQDPRWIVLRVWNRVLVSASKVQWPELSQLSLCSEFDKENSIGFSLNSLLLIHFTTVTMRLFSHGPHATLVMWHLVMWPVMWPSVTIYHTIVTLWQSHMILFHAPSCSYK